MTSGQEIEWVYSFNAEPTKRPGARATQVTLMNLVYAVNAQLLSHHIHSLSPFKWPFSRWIWVSRYQNISILDFTGAKDDGGGGDNWSYKTCKGPVKSSPPTNQHQFFLQARCPSCHPTNSVRALKEISPHPLHNRN